MYATACSPRANTIARAGRAGTSSTTLSGCSLLRGATRDVRARAFGGLFGKAKGGVAKEPQVRLEAYEGDDEPGDWPFQVVAEREGYEVRLYDTHLFIRTPYEGRTQGLSTLATYLDGGNTLGVTVPASQPVLMEYTPTDTGLSKTMRLLVPKPAQGAPPLPTNAGVELNVASCEVMAVITFSGNVTPQVADAARARLTGLLARDGVESVDTATGVFRVAQYGQLYSLMQRKNELWLQLSSADAAKLA